MIRFLRIALGAWLLLFVACKPSVVEDTNESLSPSIAVFQKFDELQVKLDNSDHELQVVNFWMTSCPPCIKEMPHFNQLEQEFGAQGINIVLVSLDRARDLESRVIPFVEKYEVLSEVVLLEDQNYSAWTGIIHSGWYGALPATLIMSGDQRHFKFGAYQSYEELRTDVQMVLKKDDLGG